MGAQATGNFYFYEKKPFPSFSGKKRDFIGLRRKWKEVVTSRYPGQEFLI